MTEMVSASDRCDNIVFLPFNARRGPWSVRGSKFKIFRKHCDSSRQKKQEQPYTLEETFNSLAEQWQEDTWLVSSLKRKISHPAYLRIIGLGPDAVPLLLKDLKRSGGYWSWALEAITREDPAPNATTMQQLRDAWLAWGKSHGYSF